MSVDALVKATENLDTDDLADIVPNLPESAVHSSITDIRLQAQRTPQQGPRHTLKTLPAD